MILFSVYYYKMSGYYDDYNDYGPKSGGIIGILFSPITIFAVTIISLGVYGAAIRKNVIDTSNEKQLEQEIFGLFTAGAIILMIASFTVGDTKNVPGRKSIKVKFILSILLIHLITLSSPIINFLVPDMPNVYKHSIQNFAKSIILGLFVFFLIGCSENMGERGIKLQYVFLIVLFEILFTLASIWYGLSVFNIGAISQENVINEQKETETMVPSFSGEFAPF